MASPPDSGRSGDRPDEAEDARRPDADPAPPCTPAPLACHPGAHHFHAASVLLLFAAVGGWVLRSALYFRPTPYGGPYVANPLKYYFHSLFYGGWGAALLAAPALGLWLALWTRPCPRWLVRLVHGLTVAALTAGLIGDHFDDEVQRFMGVHATPAFIATYHDVAASKATVLHAIADDAGGPWVSLGLWIVIPSAYVAVALWWLRRRRARPAPRWRRSWAVAGVAAALGVPWAVRLTPGAQFRIRRVEPYVVRLWRDPWNVGAAQPPPNLGELIRLSQTHWRKATQDPRWTLPRTDYPYLRVPQASGTPDRRRNVILIQVETLRGLDVGHLNPARGPSATPFLDELAARGTSYARALSFGPPTVNAFMGVHCSLLPHTTVNVSVQLAHIDLWCLPQAMRRRGWYTAFFTGNDPDWDGERVWLERWYDENHFFPEADEDDRVTFRLTADRILELGRRAQPFLATLVSATNHAPFRSLDPALDVNSGATPAERVLNTTHYTDHVLRELFDRLSGEPWFENTLVVLYGDHGWNLGEHSSSPAGQRNGYSESVWVPLMFVGSNWPGPKGTSDAPASLLDVAPTVADWVGITEQNPWLGVSLLQPLGDDRTIVVRRGSASVVAFGSNQRFSFALNPETGEPELFAATDRLQHTDIAHDHPAVVREFGQLVDSLPDLNDYLLETNRVWPPVPP